MKLIVFVPLAILCGQSALAADKTILELQRDILLLQEDMRAMNQRLGTVQTLIEKLAQQVADSSVKSDTRSEKLQGSVDQTKSALTTQIAGVGTKLDGVAGDVSTLRDGSAEVTRQITSMRSQMEEMNNVLKALQSPAAAPPPAEGQPQPTKLFTDATRDMNDKPDLALTEFSDFVRLFPNDPLTPRAQFNIGQIHYGQNAFDPAAKDFDAVLANYPDSQQVPDAMYMRGLALLKGGHRPAAAESFKALVAKYPQSSQASQARDLLRALAPAPVKKSR